MVHSSMLINTLPHLPTLPNTNLPIISILQLLPSSFYVLLNGAPTYDQFSHTHLLTHTHTQTHTQTHQVVYWHTCSLTPILFSQMLLNDTPNLTYLNSHTLTWLLAHLAKPGHNDQLFRCYWMMHPPIPNHLFLFILGLHLLEGVLSNCPCPWSIRPSVVCL